MEPEPVSQMQAPFDADVSPRGVVRCRECLAVAFGRQDWLAHTARFALYHTQKVWTLPHVFLTVLPFSLVAR